MIGWLTLGAGAGQAAAADCPEPSSLDLPKLSPQVANATVQVAVSSTAAVVKADDLGVPSVTDGGQSTGPLVKISLPAQPPKSLQTNSATPCVVTVLTFQISGVPQNYDQQRFAVLARGKAKPLALSYRLSNAPPGTPSLFMRATDGIGVRKGDAFPITVSTGAVRADDLAIVQATLIEKTTHQPLGAGQLALCDPAAQGTACDGCRAKTRKCDNTISLNPHTSKTLLVSGAAENGDYAGNIVVTSAEAPEGVSSPGRVLVSDEPSKWLGVGLIGLGIGIAWFVNTYLRGLWVRQQWLLQASEFSESLTSLRANVAAVGGVTPTRIFATIDALKTRLQRASLKSAGLPSLIPAPFADPLADDARQKFQAFMQSTSDWLKAVHVVVCDGWTVVARRYALAADPSDLPNLKTQLSETDALLPSDLDDLPAPTADKLIDDLAGILTGSAAATPALAFAALPRRGAPSVPSVRELRASVGTISLAGWIFLLLVTLAAGVYAVVFANGGAGFGTQLDLANAFLWGLGLPTGAVLAQSTVASITTSLGLSRPQ